MAQNHELYDDITYISGVILSDELKSHENNPYTWINTIYIKTLQHKKGDIGETLFLLTFATLQFRTMPLELPLIGDTVHMPLPRPTDSLFFKRNNAIPQKFPYHFFTSKNEKDKYSHFFGNAFLAFNVRIFNLSKFMGIFVEYFEDAFKVEGAVDSKDLSVNQLGEVFGVLLRDNPDLMPSEILESLEFIFSLKF
ncbi:MAG: hypothetical protein SCALA702_30770 [Melioribacteraceae bacterium]|nr:MAG: hypothetical protein SCALA702_30770 [Melioribacteraceae bacterium]